MRDRISVNVPDRSRPVAIVEWPHGLDGPPIVYPNGGSDEIDRQISELLKSAVRPARIGKAAA